MAVYFFLTGRIIKSVVKKSKKGKEYLSLLVVDATEKDGTPFDAVCTRDSLVKFIDEKVTPKMILNITGNEIPQEYKGKISAPSHIITNVEVAWWGGKKKEEEDGSVLSESDFDTDDLGTLDDVSEEAIRKILNGSGPSGQAKTSAPASALDEAMEMFNSL